MTSIDTNPKVDSYIDRETRWRSEVTALRAIALGCSLTEDFKWGTPCYTHNGRNIVLIHTFKEYCALLLFKGALLDNSHGLLVQQSENTQAARQIRFTALPQVTAQEAAIRATLFEAIEVEKAGLKVPLTKSTDLVYPEEFQQKLDALPALKAAFEALTPGRRRAYNLHFSAPKQSKTRAARVEKCIPQILAGKGLND